MVILSIILVLSIAVNALLGWYMIKLLRRFLFLSDNLDDLLDQLDGYSMHVENVHSLEMFYGEPVLQNLMNHSRDVVAYVDDFRNDFDDTKDISELNEDEETDDGQPTE
tara:strand:- start:5 stop:331 length:327 start_codon:yes stop_codon:yes gene_type:complete